MHAVDISGLGKTFGRGADRVVALDNVNLRIERGQIFGLLGPNGAGKTTLISILAGATSHDTGAATILGHDLAKEVRAVQAEINVVRGFSGVLERVTALQLMRYYAFLYGVPRPGERIERVLRRLDLWDRREQHVSSFSSGWRQRFFLAKALVNDPKLLLLDEPTVGLDVDAAISVRRLIREFKEEGRTVLLTTHYMQEADELCDSIALISQGRIVAQGTSAQLKALVRKEESVEVRGAVTESTAKALRALEGVLGVSAHNAGARILVTGKDAMPGILGALAKAGARVELVRLEEPTLEDVFLKLTSQGLGAVAEEADE